MTRFLAHSLVCVGLALSLGGCGGGGDGPGPGPGPGPTPTPQSLAITPPTAILKVNQTETFAATLTMSNGQTQSVQPTWQSDNTTVLTFENGGQARGRRNGTATIVATHQGLQATRLVRVATDYQGIWIGDYVVRRCDESGVFVEADFCDREDGFYVGQMLEIALDLEQERDEVAGDMALGGIEGTTSGRVEADGRYVGTGSLTYTEDGISVAFFVSPLSVNADGDRLTGQFKVTVTVTGGSGEGIVEADLRTVVRSATTALPTARRASGARGMKGALDLLRAPLAY